MDRCSTRDTIGNKVRHSIKFPRRLIGESAPRPLRMRQLNYYVGIESTNSDQRPGPNLHHDHDDVADPQARETSIAIDDPAPQCPASQEGRGRASEHPLPLPPGLGPIRANCFSRRGSIFSEFVCMTARNFAADGRHVTRLRGAVVNNQAEQIHPLRCNFLHVGASGVRGRGTESVQRHTERKRGRGRGIAAVRATRSAGLKRRRTLDRSAGPSHVSALHFRGVGPRNKATTGRSYLSVRHDIRTRLNL